jgi:transcriptional regulator
MFVPNSYRQPDNSWMADVMVNNPLALMTSNGAPGEVPFATHLPVIPEPASARSESARSESADIAGSIWLGHLNRANPHWSAIEDGSVVLLTFTGPHAYVSPTVYGFTPAAPTWDFTSVHVRGTIQKIDSIEATLGVVQATVRAFETRFGANWDMTGSVDYFRQIVPAVGAFRIRVIGAEGMFKLSQEQSSEVRDRVRLSFSRSPCTRHRELAGLMDRLP